MKFTELKIWQKSHQLTLEIYKITQKFPSFEKFAVASQLQRASSSVPANIVEGYNRKGNKEFLQFLFQSKGSLAETEYFIILVRDLGYIDSNVAEKLLNEYEDLSKMLNSFITYVRNQN